MEYLFLIVNHSVTLTNMKKKSTPQVNNQGYAKWSEFPYQNYR